MQTLREKFSTGPEDKKKKYCCRWRSFRFLLLFLISVLLILLAYEFKSDPVEEEEGGGGGHGRARFLANSSLYDGNNSRKAVFDINDIITHDRWVVLQPDDGNNLSEEVRESLTCAVIEASFDQGWRPLILADRSACCSKPRCVLLHSEKRARLPYETRKFLEDFRETSEKNKHLQRNLAYLFAIQHGARFVLDWYLEDHDLTNIEEYQNKTMQLLQSTTLDISLGLVLESLSEAPLFAVSPRPTRRLYNPHSHFGRPDLWPPGYQPPSQRSLVHTSRKRPFLPWALETQNSRMRNHSKIETFSKQRYRVCEIRPPSIELFLNQPEEGSLDLSAPPVTIPSDTLSPASSKIAIYSGDALWALALLPNSDDDIPYQLLRTLWSYPLVANIAAGIKVSLSPLSSGIPYTPSISKGSAELTNAVMRWRCNSRSILTCIVLLSHELGPKFSENASGLLSSWSNDLKRLRYLEPPVVPLRRGGMQSPCLGHHGLGGLTFQAASYGSAKTTSQTKRKERQRQIYQHYEQDFKLLEWMSRLNSTHHSNKSVSPDEMEETSSPIPPLPVEHVEFVNLDDSKQESVSSLQKEIVDEMCLGFSNMLPIVSQKHFEKTLLIVAFDSDEVFEQLPMIDVIYRTHFRNILYCGSPHASLNTYLHKLQSENRTISYLPAMTPGYECLVGAMEMDYHVEGYLLASAHSLLLPESLKNLDKSVFWYGNDENNLLISKKSWRDVDPGGKKIPRIMTSVVQALKFVAHLVGVHEEDHHESGMEDEHPHSSEETPQIPSNKTTPSEVALPEEHSTHFELHLHAEGVSPLTNLTDYETFGSGGPTEGTTKSSETTVVVEELHDGINKTVIDFVSIDHEERLPSENSTYLADSKPEKAEEQPDGEEGATFIEYDATSPIVPDASPESISENPGESELVLNVSTPNEAHPAYLDTKSRQVFNLSLPEGPGDTLINPVEDEKGSFDLESSNNYAKRTAEGAALNRTRRKAPLDPEVLIQENRVVDGAFRHIEDLIGLVLSKLVAEAETPSLPYQLPHQNSMRLDPREFKHLRCGDHNMPSFYTNKDLCTSLRQFFSNIDRLYRSEGGGFLPSYNHYPVYYVPVGQQKAFYLLANVFLQFGVPDQVAVPLILQGLANNRVHQLTRTYFGSDTPAVVEPSYPLFDETANYLFPVYLQRDLHGDKRLRTIFCLKYLYSILS
ncbi:uncharacterized protein LOC132194437 [Neocloeon triangulifer]|uniref:uncharacterized protein LOC132194437 n=1 Tax=Neocloeon triangulifer TaxID=2078957 RepID=UPI00286EFA62|nr:uncharacterized protein LOC132194437 [Neocloeon triangulifer]